MRHVHRLLLVGVVALAMSVAVGSTASATTVRIKYVTGSAYTGEWTTQLASGTNWTISGPFGATITCAVATLTGMIVNSNGTGETIDTVEADTCTDANANSCTATAYDAAGSTSWSAPWAVTFAYDSLHSSGRDATMTIAMGTSGKIRTQCGVITCDWVGSGGSHTVVGNVFNSDNSARFNATLSSNCGSGTLNVLYAPLWGWGSGGSLIDPLFVTA